MFDASESESSSSWRSLSEITDRIKYAVRAGLTFNGKRDYYEKFGYKRILEPADYRARFDRDGMAARIVEALPKATWRGGGELIEDENPEVLTAFETAWEELQKRLSIWPVMQRADVLAGLGRFSLILIGAPGGLDTPLPNPIRPEDIFYLTPYGENNVTIDQRDYEGNIVDPRYGRPNFYKLKTTLVENGVNIINSSRDVRVHWTRVIHVSDGLLDSNIFGEPRLQRVWNLLDDLMKITGGGAEAFWLRANQGLQINLDKDVKPVAGDLESLREQVDAYKHDINRIFRTRGVNVEVLGSDVANFAENTDAIILQISAATGIPHRILTGSERGELASTQDKNNWNERVSDRRLYFADPFVVRAFVDRLIEHQALPKPKDYDVRWPEVQDLDETEKAALAKAYADINKTAGETVVLPNEIRDRVLGWDPLDPSELDDEEDEEEVDAEDDDEEDDNAPPAPRAPPSPRANKTLTPPNDRVSVRDMREWLERKKRTLSIARRTDTLRRLRG